ncbi:MAG: hypothetical protein ACM3XM_15860 [Mycobacterium leprae]
MPLFTLADVAFGPIFFVVMAGAFFPFLLALVLETAILRALGWGSLYAAFIDILLANLLTTVVGCFFFWREFYLESIWFWLGAWLLSSILEAGVLYYRREVSVVRAGLSSLAFNTASYILLIWLYWPLIQF